MRAVPVSEFGPAKTFDAAGAPCRDAVEHRRATTSATNQSSPSRRHVLLRRTTRKRVRHQAPHCSYCLGVVAAARWLEPADPAADAGAGAVERAVLGVFELIAVRPRGPALELLFPARLAPSRSTRRDG
jgi:hypothetical protein